MSTASMLVEKRPDKHKFILFVCVGNSGRSQIAEALFNDKAPEGYYGISAGVKPAREVNPLVVEALKEKGIDISKNKPKPVERWMYEKAERVILMGCGEDTCPTVFVEKVENWDIEDIRGKPIEDIRRVVDQIQEKVDALIRKSMTL